jgi:hypothetical protein
MHVVMAARATCSVAPAARMAAIDPHFGNEVMTVA